MLAELSPGRLLEVVGLAERDDDHAWAFDGGQVLEHLALRRRAVARDAGAVDAQVVGTRLEPFLERVLELDAESEGERIAEHAHRDLAVLQRARLVESVANEWKIRARPERISAEAAKISGYTEEAWANALPVRQVLTDFAAHAGNEQKPSDKKLRPQEIADAVIGVLRMDERGFVPELSVFATNPF